MIFDWINRWRDKRKEHVALVIHDEFMEVVQIERKMAGLSVVGLNKTPLKPGIVKQGAILDETAFQQAIKQLFKEAKPQPIESEQLLVNIPFNQVYAFVRTFSKHTPETLMQQELLNYVENEVPYKMDELDWDFQPRSRSGKYYGLVAYPKVWRSAVSEACREIGFHDLHFMSEPQTQLGLSRQFLGGNFALISKPGTTVYLSFFLDGLLFNTFILETQFSDAEKISELIDEYKTNLKSFHAISKQSIEKCYLVGFHQDLKQAMTSALENEKQDYAFLEEDAVSLAQLVSPHDYSSTLIGLGMRTLLPR